MKQSQQFMFSHNVQYFGNYVRNMSESFPECPNYFGNISEVEQRYSLEKRLKYSGDNIDKYVMISNWANWAAIGQIAQRSRKSRNAEIISESFPKFPKFFRIASEVTEVFWKHLFTKAIWKERE